MMRFNGSAHDIPNLAKKITNISDPDRADQLDKIINVLSEDDRTLTALALSAAQADVCCLQEVENLVVMTAFHNRYLRRWTRKGYHHRVLFEGNDSRGIDVGLLSRAKVVKRQSHAQKTFADLDLEPIEDKTKDDFVFRRDCLEVDVVKNGKKLTLFVCHFKSMNGGREATRIVRETEARAVRKLVEARFDKPEEENWALLGDFNDYFEIDGDKVDDHGLGPLINDGFSFDAAMMYEPDPFNRWTHYYNPQRLYGALDHIFLSPKLADANKEARLRIIRAGQPLRAQRYDGHHFPGIGWSNPKASDHCPMSLTLEI